ncbi:MAG TPA: helix-turn-helix transcriptional regulator [Xanthobacteraceae bacterium]|jgi:DNA-binding CsgD family transcriptional regulator
MAVVPRDASATLTGPVASNAADGLDQAILRVGDAAFPEALMAHLRRIAAVDHCMVFAFTNDRNAQCLVDVGNIANGNDLGEAYAGHFHANDPNKEMMFGRDGGRDPIRMPFVPRGMYRRNYRKLFFDDAGIVDKYAAALWHDGVCIYTNFYRITASGRYSEQQVTALHRASPVLAATIARHCQLSLMAKTPEPQDVGGLLRQTFSKAPLSSLTARERDVCANILLGFSSEAIAGELDISLNSVLTYRRRAYQRLGITSQNELFSIVMTQLAARGEHLPFAARTPLRSLN